MAVKVGSFAKSTAAASVDQAITGVGFTPKVVLLWTAANTSADTLQDNVLFAFGATTGASNSYSAAIAAQDNQDTSNTSQRLAAKALTIVQWGETTLAECDLKSFDSDGFTLTWTTNNNVGYIIGYMALAGADLTNAKLVAWNTGTSVADVAVTGVGFQPDCALHFGGSLTSAGGSGGWGIFTLGAMTSSGQWANTVTLKDGAGTSTTARGWESAKCLTWVFSNAAADGSAVYKSFDADGFTVTVDNAPYASYAVVSLCLRGGNYRIGIPASYNSIGDQVVTGLGFQPEGVLFAHAVRSGTGGIAHAMLGVGAADATADVGSGIYDEDAVGTTNSVAWTATDACILAQNGSSLAEANLKTLDSDGFTLTWVDDDTLRPGYFAFAGGAVAGGNPHYAYAQQ